MIENVWKEDRFEFQELQVEDLLEIRIYDKVTEKDITLQGFNNDSNKEWRVELFVKIVELLNKVYREGFERGNDYGFENGYDACMDEYSIS